MNTKTIQTPDGMFGLCKTTFDKIRNKYRKSIASEAIKCCRAFCIKTGKDRLTHCSTKRCYDDYMKRLDICLYTCQSSSEFANKDGIFHKCVDKVNCKIGSYHGIKTNECIKKNKNTINRCCLIDCKKLHGDKKDTINCKKFCKYMTNISINQNPLSSSYNDNIHKYNYTTMIILNVVVILIIIYHFISLK